MNEAETRAEYIDPALKASGWGEIEETKILRELHITDGRIQLGGTRAKPEIADYVLVYKNKKIGMVEEPYTAEDMGEEKMVIFSKSLHSDRVEKLGNKNLFLKMQEEVQKAAKENKN